MSNLEQLQGATLIPREARQSDYEAMGKVSTGNIVSSDGLLNLYAVYDSNKNGRVSLITNLDQRTKNGDLYSPFVLSLYTDPAFTRLWEEVDMTWVSYQESGEQPSTGSISYDQSTRALTITRGEEVIILSNKSTSTTGADSSIDYPSTSGFNKESADIITGYNPKSDSPIQINLEGFSKVTGRLKIARKSKQVSKFAKESYDFIYDRQAGYLYYNENKAETGFGDGGIIAILEGKPKVGLGNFEFI